MRRRRWGALGLILLAATSDAAPFFEPFQAVQPGGQPVALRRLGDEYSEILETPDGYTVVYSAAAGSYDYAVLNATRAALVTTGVRAGEADPSKLGLDRHLRVDPASASAGIQTMRKALGERACADGETVGSYRGLVILVDFSDEPAAVSREEVDGFCNQDGYRGCGNVGSVSNYFAFNSGGKVAYASSVTLYYRATHPKSYYDDPAVAYPQRAQQLVSEALSAVSADHPEYLVGVSTDGDTNIYAITVLYAGSRPGSGGVHGDGWGSGLWPHAGALPDAVHLAGGKRATDYALMDIGTGLTLGPFCHEIGHMLCGFPDLYDHTFGSRGGVGQFCLMGDGACPTNPVQFCAYLKVAAGWATNIDLNTSSAIMITAASVPGPQFNQFYRYENPARPTEYFLIENRQPTLQDSSLPAGGIAIWHIDEKGDQDNPNVVENTTYSNGMVTLVQADGRWDMEQNANAGDVNDLYRRGNTASGYANAFSDVTSPAAHWWDGTRSGLDMSAFTSSGPYMFFMVNSRDAVPPSVTILEPGPDQVVSGMVQVVARATDNSGFLSEQDVVLLAGSERVGGLPVLTAPDTYTFLWDSSTKPSGTVQLSVEAKDLCANEGSASIPIHVQNPASLTVTLSSYAVNPGAPLSIAGRLCGSAGSDPADASVSVTLGALGSDTTTTDLNGCYLFENVPAPVTTGAYPVTVTAVYEGHLLQTATALTVVACSTNLGALTVRATVSGECDEHRTWTLSGGYEYGSGDDHCEGAVTLEGRFVVTGRSWTNAVVAWAPGKSAFDVVSQSVSGGGTSSGHYWISGYPADSPDAVYADGNYAWTYAIAPWPPQKGPWPCFTSAVPGQVRCRFDFPMAEVGHPSSYSDGCVAFFGVKAAMTNVVNPFSIVLPTNRASWSVSGYSNAPFAWDCSMGTVFDGGPGSASLDVRLDFAGTEPADAVAVVEPNAAPFVHVSKAMPVYEEWLPKGGSDEATEGNRFHLTVRLHRASEGDTRPLPKARFKFRLTDISREPGVCLNWPHRDYPARLDVTPPPLDLGFAPVTDSNAPYTVQYDSDTEITAETKDPAESFTIPICCYDFGARGTITVTATTEAGEVLETRIANYPDRTSLALPLDDNGNGIADAWERKMGIAGRRYGPDCDDDSVPAGQAGRGDGLALWEEYRGFMVQGVHHRLSPWVKDVFVRDANGIQAFIAAGGPGLPSFTNALQGAVHWIASGEWTGAGESLFNKRVINFNSSGYGHVGDQHGLDLQLDNSGRPWTSPDPVSDQPDDPVNCLSRSHSAKGDQPGSTYADAGAAVFAGPGGARLCAVRPDVIKQELWKQVWWNTQALSKYRNWANQPPQKRAVLREQLRQDTTAYITNHADAAILAYRFQLGLAATRELGHAVGMLDHTGLPLGDPAAKYSGDWTCMMRYLRCDDFGRDADDRFEMERRKDPRYWPARFCAASTCQRRVQISDFMPVVRTMAAEEVVVTDDVVPRAADAGDVETAVAVPAFSFEIELVGQPAYEGDPLRLRVRLSQPAYQQQMERYLAGLTDVLPTNATPEGLAATWTERMWSLCLVRMDTSELVLWDDAWKPYRQCLSNELACLDTSLPVWSCEYLVPGATAGLTAGRYLLTGCWDGRGINGAPPTTESMVWAPDLMFAVVAPSNVVQAADHVGRLAYEADVYGRPEEALSLGQEALARDGSGSSGERSDTYALVAGLAFDQHQYGLALQTLESWSGNSSDPDAARLLGIQEAAMAPRLGIGAGAAGQPVTVDIFGWPDQMVVTEQSSDLIHWGPLSSNQIGSEAWFELSVPVTNALDRCAYRAVWYP